MNAYSEDLRKKIVEALERGMPKIEAARIFGVGISSVKRYMATYREGRSLVPKKRPGSKPKLECESARKLLEANLKEHPGATLPQRREFSCGGLRGVEVSDSTVSRVLKRMGFSRKKIGGCERERRISEGGLAVDGRRRDPRRAAAGVRGRVLHQHLVGTPV